MSQINSTLDLMAYRSFGRLAVVLRNRNDAILRRWEETVRHVLPNADRLTMGQLRNSLPDIMEQIAKALESDQPDTTLALIELTRPHGATRFHQQFSIRELLAEYRMWRRILIEEVWRGAGGPLDESEVTALNMAVDTALEGAILAYTDFQFDQIREAAEIESKYLSFLSHDLRNNLNHATLLLQLQSRSLGQSPGFEQAAQDLEAIHRSIAQTMAGMERLLQAERLRKRAVELKRETVNLRSAASGIAQQFAVEARDKGLALQVQVPEDLTVHSDSELIGLALQNLVGNAVKYSQRGQVRIAGERDPSGDGWVLSVSDEGPGIAPGEMDRLFRAFARGQSHGQPGVGLGLAIAAEAAKLLGGELKVESQLGQGTTFRVMVRDEPL